MTIRQQPKGSLLCGQCCVAMIADISSEECLAVFGHVGGTTTKMLAKALCALGYECSAKLARIKGQLPSLCIVKMAYPDKGPWHWVVCYEGRIYDPSHGVYSIGEEIKFYGTFTSYLEVKAK